MLARIAPLVPVLVLVTGCLNVGVVEEGRVYRCSQPTPDDLRHLFDTYGIRTVINLRGEKPDKLWWRLETSQCEASGVAHRDVRMSAMRYPRPDEILEVLDVLEEAEYPILIHCLAGADRTGLVSAIYRIVHLDHHPETADDSLTIWHGHLGWPFGTGEMGAFVEWYESTGEGQDFRTWVDGDYRRLHAEMKGEDPPEGASSARALP